MADPALGAKQICPNCQAKFYDLAKRPAHCPKCATEFDPEEAVKFRRTRARSTPEFEEAEEAEDQVKAGEAEETEEEEAAAPEIDEAGEDETVVGDDEDEEGSTPEPEPAPAGDIEIEDDVELEEDEDDAVPFLEEDEDDTFEEDIEGLPEEGDEER